MKIKLENTTFVNTHFKKLSIQVLPYKLEKAIKKNGYKTVMGNIRFPIMSEDPNNAYSSICTGWSEPFSDRIHLFDKDIYEQYRKHVKNKIYDKVIIKSNWFHPEIYAVNFFDSIIEDTIFDNIYFSNVESNNTIYDTVTFKKMTFNHVAFNDSTFKKCRFEDVEFRESLFSGTTFENCQFVNGRHYDCHFRCQFYSSLFDKWEFDHCKINHLSSLFNNCQFNDFSHFCFDSSRKLISFKNFNKYINKND